MASYPPPPAYSEEELRPHVPLRDSANQFRVNRKPLPTNGARPAALRTSESPLYSSEHDPRSLNNLISDRPEFSVKTSLPSTITNSNLYDSPGERYAIRGPISSPNDYNSVSSVGSFHSAVNSPITTPGSSTSSKSATTYIQKAYQEARHFVGGLISHPYESTKHFTILRHSHGLVFYQGGSTTLAISIFSDAPLPIGRTLWLQNKGWSGKTGMKVKSLVGRNGSWLDVTPTIAVGTEQLNLHDERAWQRDLNKFQKKAHAKIRDNHIPRETAVIRIPTEAGDGYFQIVMCAGEKNKVLCTSPVFRLLSTSTSPSSLRGASLSTLPLELGAKVLTSYASKTVGTMVSPVASTLQSSVQQYMPSFWAQEAATVAYGLSGVEHRIDSTLETANRRFDGTRKQALATVGDADIALEQGPKSPYPIRVTGRTQFGASNMVEELQTLVFSLTGVDEGMMHKLHGYYFGWARTIEKSDEDEHTWTQAIISVLTINVTQLARVNIAQANKRTLTLRLISDFDNIPADGATFEIHVLGFIRPDEPGQRANLERGIKVGDEAAHQAAMISELNDVRVAQEILDHPSWSPDVAVRPKLQEHKTSGFQKITEGYANTMLAAQKQIDRVPLHKVGIRLEGDKLRDKAIVANGFYVTR